MITKRLFAAFVLLLIPSISIPSFLLGLNLGLASRSANPDGEVLLAYVLLAFMILGTIAMCWGAWRLRKARLSCIRSEVTHPQ